MKSQTDVFVLSDGNRIPCIGFGTYLIADADEAYRSVTDALALGYRHIDTAAIYRNEQSVGRAVRDSGIPRDEIFVTSKVWASENGYDRASRSIDASLERLGLDYMDMCLVHWPANAKNFADWQKVNADTWRAFEQAKLDGRIKTIGVSNFLTSHLDALACDCRIMPAVDQIEYHPGLLQQDTVEYCKRHGVHVEAWSPIGRARILGDPVLGAIARKHGKSVAQVCIAFALANGVLPLPKSTHKERMAENIDVFDFALDAEDIAAIMAQDDDRRYGSHPDEQDFCAN